MHLIWIALVHIASCHLLPVSMTAVAGEFQSLSYILHSSSDLPSTEPSATLEGQIRDVPVPNQQSGRVALFLHECAQISYPKVDIITVGKEECQSLWRKFPYASPSTSVMLPNASLRVSCFTIPSEPQLGQLTNFLQGGQEAPRIPGCSLVESATPFDSKVLDVHWVQNVQNVHSSKALIFVCLHSTFCGGHGDRLFGLLSAYLAALLSGRAFYIDMRGTHPLVQSAISQEILACDLGFMHDISLDLRRGSGKFGWRYPAIHERWLGGFMCCFQPEAF